MSDFAGFLKGSIHTDKKMNEHHTVMLMKTRDRELQTKSQDLREKSKKKKKTRIVRGSDYSPASELFARVRKTMAGNNPKLDLINTDALKKIGQILSICSQGIVRKQNSESIKDQNSFKSLQKNDRQQSQARSCQY